MTSDEWWGLRLMLMPTKLKRAVEMHDRVGYHGTLVSLMTCPCSWGL